MSKVEAREWSAWVLVGIIGITGLVGGWMAYHNDFSLKDDMESMGTSLLMIMKNTQRGRLASYDEIPESELTEREKVNKTIIEYDLKNIDQIEQAIGLEVPE